MEFLRKNWWIIALQGLLFSAIGVFTLFNLGISLESLIGYLGVLFLVLGVFTALWSIKTRKRHSFWWAFLLFALIQLALGALIVYDSSQATYIFSIGIGIWAISMGISQLLIGIRTKSSGRLVFYLNALVSIVLGALIILNPFETARANTYMIGFYSLLLGLYVLYYSVKVRRAKSHENIEELRESKSEE